MPKLTCISICTLLILWCFSSLLEAQAVELARTEIASGLSSPVFVTAPPGDTDRLFVLEQPGKIKIITLSDNTVLGTPFLDITTEVDSFGNEQGLLGLAFHPDYTNNGYFYVYYIFDTGGGDVTRISRFRATEPPYSTAVTADENSETILLTYSQPQPNHNGGMLAFEPRDDNKAYLYISSGDGGGGGDDDAGHGTEGNGQDLTTLLGKILRIDVDEGGEGAGTGGDNYDIPPSNPALGGLDEIWAYGLRNPYRMGFDRLTGDLYIADVGQLIWEEINHQPADSPGGENYGWRLKEGPDCFNPSSDCDPGGLTDPIYSYDHDPENGDGVAVIGGYPYRGIAIPFIEGHYIFGDVNGLAKTFLSNGSSATLVQHWEPALLTSNISSFGEDGEGELYFTIRGSKNGSTGLVYKIIPDGHDIIQVDFNATGLMKGNALNPFNTMDLATRSVATGGLVEIDGGSSQVTSNEQLTIDRAMTLSALNGTIWIGMDTIPSVSNSHGFVTRN